MTTDELEARPEFSGIYPHLTHRNYDPDHASECSVAAIVPWAGKLWTITYPADKPEGSLDKLRSIDEKLNMEESECSVGGTHANRFIHKESKQLIIGLYFIDAAGNVRAISPRDMPGRQTAVARHLHDPANKVYFYQMEGSLYEVNVHTLEVKRLFEKAIPGWHGKGAYSGQGRLVVANNGEWPVRPSESTAYLVEDIPETPDRAGALAEWDGQEWRLMHRVQHCEVTGPGGIFGNDSEQDPLWCTGFDKRSILLRCLENGNWHTYRLPKGSYTHDGQHGWHTEWPRIREVQPNFLLMHMHGLLWDFPKSFSTDNSAGLKPIAQYHKMMVDYCGWNGKIAMACNDATVFGNPWVTQPQSNIRFLDRKDIMNWGPRAGFGGPLVDDDMNAGHASEPYIFAGFKHRVLHLSHKSDTLRSFLLELDTSGTGEWISLSEHTVEPGATTTVVFPTDLDAVWIRIVAKSQTKAVTAFLIYSEDRPARDQIFSGLADVNHEGAVSGGIIRPLGSNLQSLQYIATIRNADGTVTETNLEVTTDLAFQKSHYEDKDAWFKREGTVETLDFEADAASVIIRDPQGNAYRLPKGDAAFDAPCPVGLPRGKREVVTERSLWNCHGTFYEVPRDNSGGIQKIQPLCTHNRMITDYCSWQGMLVLTGVDPTAEGTKHVIRSDEHGAALWLGDVDDLFSFGKPVGTGGPWRDSHIRAGDNSDPYLMLGYDRKSVSMSHDSNDSIIFTLEIDPTGTGSWSRYREIACPPGETTRHTFPTGFSAHWIRVRANNDCTATCSFVYE